VQQSVDSEMVLTLPTNAEGTIKLAYADMYLQHRKQLVRMRVYVSVILGDSVCTAYRLLA
jgi:hypothetical protein